LIAELNLILPFQAIVDIVNKYSVSDKSSLIYYEKAIEYLCELKDQLYPYQELGSTSRKRNSNYSLDSKEYVRYKPIRRLKLEMLKLSKRNALSKFINTHNTDSKSPIAVPLKTSLQSINHEKLTHLKELKKARNFGKQPQHKISHEATKSYDIISGNIKGTLNGSYYNGKRNFKKINDTIKSPPKKHKFSRYSRYMYSNIQRHTFFNKSLTESPQTQSLYLHSLKF